MERGLTEREICDIILEEMPENIGGETDIESDGDDDETVLTPVVTNFDRVFQRELQDLSTSVPIESNSVEELEVIDDRDDMIQPGPSTSSVCAKRIFGQKEILKKKCRSVPKVVEPNRQWRKRDVTTNIPAYKGQPEGPVTSMFAACNSATDIFITTIEPAISDIVFQSNLYAKQLDPESKFTITSDELLAFLGINFLMGYVIMPSFKDYWSTSPDLGSPLVINTMTRTRFQAILTNLHVNNNRAVPSDCTDKLYKLRPLIEKMNNQFRQIYNVSREVSIDESVILFKGRSTLKQYNPMKPIKRGFKLWCMADSKGYISNFDVYQGKGQVIEEFSSYGLGERVVLQLTKPYWKTWLKVYFDNYYSSLNLLEKLKTEEILACGTIKKERKGLPPLAVDKDLERGEYDFRYSNLDIGVFKWIDNRPVYFATNFHGCQETIVQRRNKEGTKVVVKCPEVVKDYNRYMGCVDLADQLRQLCCVNRKSRKWWQRIFWGIIDIAFVNSYIIYNALNPENKLTVLQFRRCVSQGLMSKIRKERRRSYIRETNTSQPKRGKLWSVANDVRLGNKGIHFIEFVSKRGRCEVCGKNKIESWPRSICNMCKVYLCVNDKKNCFKEFHEF